MAKRQSQKKMTALKDDRRYLLGLADGMGIRFGTPGLKRLMQAIREDKPLLPPEGRWDIGSMLVTANALVARATALMCENIEGVGSDSTASKRIATSKRRRRKA